jgi:3',5'-cyclic AMP phosphodiesterase CpdA
VRALVSAVRLIQPDVVAVSGDLTQRARRQEFERARAFLDALPGPQIVVPGNHDVPFHNLLARFGGALDNYRRYISEDLEPFYADEEIAILGLNTARSMTIKGGRVNSEQIRRVEEKLCGFTVSPVRMLVTHHPFDLPANYDARHLVGRARKAMLRFARCGVDIFLAGHFHVTHCGPTAERYDLGGYSAIFVQAGTACSTRGRGEPNSFNVIRADKGTVTVETCALDASGSFRSVSRDEFLREEQGWGRVS